MKRFLLLVPVVLVLIISVGQEKANAENGSSRVQQGLAIAPVPLDLQGRNRALVGLGSYIVNAQAD